MNHIKCSTSLSIYNSYDILQDWQEVIRETEDDIQMDMSELEDLDTAGIQLLLALKKECTENKCSLKFTGWQEEMVSFLQLTGCKQLLEIEGERNE